jgi:hypothetical protein
MLVPGQHLFVGCGGGDGWMGDPTAGIVLGRVRTVDSLPIFLFGCPCKAGLGREFTKLGPQGCQVWDRVPKRDEE